jgi:hypothetical protein
MTQEVNFPEEINIPTQPIPLPKPKPRPRHKQYELVYEPYNTVRGETAVWVAVITQAMMDAMSNARSSEALYHKHEATAWLTGNSKDFITVCHLAGMDPGYVRRKAKRALVAPIAWRAKAGSGKRYQERKSYRERTKPAPPTPITSITPTVITGPWATPKN